MAAIGLDCTILFLSTSISSTLLLMITIIYFRQQLTRIITAFICTHSGTLSLSDRTFLENFREPNCRKTFVILPSVSLYSSPGKLDSKIVELPRNLRNAEFWYRAAKDCNSPLILILSDSYSSGISKLFCFVIPESTV